VPLSRLLGLNLLSAGAVLAFCSALTANASTFTVTATADSGPGSLRDALQQANASSPARIEVAVPGIIAISAALPTITADVTIVGTGGSPIVLSGRQTVPLLSVASQGSLSVQGLTLADGLGEGGGGALYNLGNVVLLGCIVSNNVGTNLGGAVLNYGTLVLEGCTFVSNRVFGLTGRSLISTNTAETGFNAEGGAICSRQGTLLMTNCTVWGNLALGGHGGDNGLGAGGAGGAALGGGLFWTAAAPSTNWMVNCTISANQVLGGPGGQSGSIFGPPGPAGWGTGGGLLLITNTVSLRLLNTILAGNTADHALPDGYVSAPLLSLGGNFVGVTNGLTGFTPADLLGVDPQLGPLRSNGGPVPTCALPIGSPAIDQGQTAGAPAFDARGVIRPQGNGFDIGAYELGNQRILFPDPGANLTYGDPPYQLIASATSDLPVTFTVVAGPGLISPTNGSRLVLTGAGSISVVASQAGSDIYLPAQNVTNGFAVTPAFLAVVANDASRPYGETNPPFSGTVAGLVNGDAITASFQTAATLTTPAGVYGPASSFAITPVLADPSGRLANYTLLSTNGTLTLTKATLPLIATGLNTNRPYAGTNPPFQGTLQNLLNGDAISVAWVCAATPGSPVGNYPIVPAWNDPGGLLPSYNLVTNAGVLGVLPVPLSVTAADASRPYGATNPAFAGLLIGLMNGDPITAGFQTAATLTTRPGVYGPASPYAITPVLADPAGRLINYTVLSTNGTLTITKATLPLIATGLSTNRPYAGTNPPFQGTLQNLLNGDAISAAWVCAATPGSPVGNYPIVPAWNDPGGLLPSYNLVTNAGVLGVLPVPLSVTAVDGNRPYGATNPAFAGLLIGLMNGDAITASFQTAATLTTPAGVYGPASPFAITPVLTDPFGRLANYTLLSTNGTLTITKATLPLIATGLSTNRPYAGTNPPFQGTLQNLLNGDAISATWGCDATPASPVANYPILPMWNDPNRLLANYSVVTNVGLLAVLPIPLSVTAADASRPYGATNPAFAGLLIGLMNGDPITAGFQTAATLTTRPGVYGPASPYAITPVLADPAGRLINYTVLSTNGTLTIAKATLPLIATGLSTNRPYAGTNPPFQGTLQNLLNGDAISVAWVCAATPGSPVGNYPILPAWNDPGGLLPSYNLVTNAGVLGVLPVPLSVTATDASRPYGATNPAFSGLLVGLMNGDPITASFQTAATLTTPVGVYGPANPLAITPVLADPSGRLGNYTVLSTNGTLTITNAALPLIATGLSTNRLYAGTNPPFQGTLQNLLNGDAISATWVCAATPASPVGGYPIRPVWSDPAGRLANYNLVTNAGNLAVLPVPLNVTAADASRPYGAANLVFSGTLTGLLNGDPITAAFRSTAVKTTPPGIYGPNSPYAIQPMLIDPAGRLGNYTVTTNNGTLTITKATQPLTVMALSTNRLYGTTNLAWPVVITGILNGDPISAAWVSPATPGSAIGLYPMMPAWNDPEGLLANYVVMTNTGSLTVTPASLVAVAADGSRGYGITNPTFTGTLTGVVNRDPITVRFLSPATPATPPGVYGPGSALAITPSLVDPANRAGNYITTLVQGTLTILAIPTVSILEPTNGALYFTGMDVPAEAAVTNITSPIQSAVFLFSTNQLPGLTTNGTDFTTTLTNVAWGPYSMQAIVTNALGLAFLSAPVSFTVVDLTATLGPVDTNSLEVLQTGLYFQDLWITNIASLPIPAVLVEVTGLRPGVQVYNAVETTNGASFLRYDYPTPPGQVLRLRTEYYVPDGVCPVASFAVHLAKPAAAFLPAGTFVPINYFAYPFGNGAALCEFRTVAGKAYYVQYSADLTTWTTALPAVMGNANWIEWLDNGPPKTISLPANALGGHRFYRVLRAP